MCEAVVTLSRDVSKQDELSPITEDLCWICHEGGSEEAPLANPCRCRAMKAHQSCLARWQLQQAGKNEERFCRFCSSELPDWREAHAELPKASPTMTVVHNYITHQVAVEPGPDGKQRFQVEIRRIFNLGDGEAIQLTFGCRVPGSGHEITLEGWDAFDAAVHCAAVSAGQRLKMHKEEQQARKVVQRRSSSAGMLRRLFSRTSSQQGT